MGPSGRTDAKQAYVDEYGRFLCTNTDVTNYEDKFGYSTYCAKHKSRRPVGSKKCPLGPSRLCQAGHNPFNAGIVVAGVDMPLRKDDTVAVHDKDGKDVSDAVWLDFNLKLAKVIKRRDGHIAIENRNIGYELVSAKGWTIGPFYWKDCPDTDFFVVV